MDAGKTKLWRGDLNKLLQEFQQKSQQTHDADETSIVPMDAAAALLSRDDSARITKPVSSARSVSSTTADESPGPHLPNQTSSQDLRRCDNPGAPPDHSTAPRPHLRRPAPNPSARRGGESPWEQPTLVARHFGFAWKSRKETEDRGKTRLLSRFPRLRPPDQAKHGDVPSPPVPTPATPRSPQTRPSVAEPPVGQQTGSGLRLISQQQTVVLPEGAWGQARQPNLTERPQADFEIPRAQWQQTLQRLRDQPKKLLPLLCVVLVGMGVGMWGANGVGHLTSPSAAPPKPNAPAAKPRQSETQTTPAPRPQSVDQGSQAALDNPNSEPLDTTNSRGPAGREIHPGKVSRAQDTLAAQPTLRGGRGSPDRAMDPAAEPTTASERDAVNALLAGDMSRAIQHYEHLAHTHPDQPAFTTAARILREWAQRPSGS